MRERALITGATAGLGAEFARQLAARGMDLILVARDAERLTDTADSLRKSHGVDVETITADLVTDDGVAATSARLAENEKPVSLLVNNAGFGLVKSFERNSLQEEREHLRIQVQTPMELMHAVLPGMLERAHGHVINVASVAAFIPRASYGAAKSWQLSLSRWANLHYQSRGVHVMALCPGFVRTEFHQRMNASTKGIADWMWLDAPFVVTEAIKDAGAGKSVSVPSIRFKALTLLSRFAPDPLLELLGRRGR